MKRFLSLGFALALISSAFAACTLDFDQFEPVGTGGTGGIGVGGTGGTGGATCNGGCCTAADCTTPTDPCQQATCTANTCGEEPRPDGTEVAMQTAGDCKKGVCQGGAVASVNDDGDTLDDGNDCTADGCTGGAPQSIPELVGTACMSGGGKLCDGNSKCVACLDDIDCPDDAPVCDDVTHGCIPATCGDGEQNGSETDTDCGGPLCSPCDDGEKCDVGPDCVSGVCGNGGMCDAPKCNDGVKNGAEGHIDCGASCPEQCGPDQGCNADDDCDGNDCTGVAGTCVPNCDDGVTNNLESDVDCGGGTCDGCALGDDCANVDSNCLSGVCGADDKCEASPIGATCLANGDCLSGQCEDGVCCNMDCGGTCKSCNLAATKGTCTNIATGQDPDDECNGAQVCQGGACKKPDGQACGAPAECLAGHFCVDGVCCAVACNGTCEACNLAGSPGTCTPVANGQDPAGECSGVTSCDGAGMCTKLANGALCAANVECQGNNCVDGVCCDNACNTLCKSCNVAGSAGTCTNIPNGTDPNNECMGGTPSCNGSGACN